MKLFILFIALLFLLINGVSAVDNVNSTDKIINENIFKSNTCSVEENTELSLIEQNLTDDNDYLSAKNIADEKLSDNSSDQNVTEKVSFSQVTKTNYLIKQTFEVKLLDSTGNGLANKTVYFTINGITLPVITDNNGVAKFIIDVKKGTYTISYKFNETGYTPISASKNILVLSTSTSTVKATHSKIYAGIKCAFKVTLKVDGIVLPGRTIKFIVDKKTYTKKTNSKGEASVTLYLSKGTHKVKYSYAGETNIKSVKATSKVKAKLIKNPYKTKYRKVLIDADGGFTKSFLKNIAKKLRKCGWRVIIKGIGPGQHSINYKLVKKYVYMPFYNGLCAGTIYEMPQKYYGGVLKRNKAILTPAWYTKDWTSKRMKQYRNDISKIKFLKRAWDDNFSPKKFKGMNKPAKFMTKHKIKYCVADTTYKIVDQFVHGGWVAYNK